MTPQTPERPLRDGPMSCREAELEAALLSAKEALESCGTGYNNEGGTYETYNSDLIDEALFLIRKTLSRDLP